MSDSRPKVLYAAGTIHGGSTILGNVLGQVDGFFHAGELIHIWRALREDTLCGCGLQVKDCEVWRAVFAEAYGGLDKIDAAEMDGLVGQLSRVVARRGEFRSVVLASNWADVSLVSEYIDVTGRLYQAIQRVSGCRVIVDTSKAIWYGHLLGSRAPVNLYPVHLVRDPRGVNYSLYRKYKGQRQADGAWSAARYAIRTSRAWMLSNLGAELLWRKPGQRSAYVLLRYEDFVAGPLAALRKVAAFVQEEVGNLDFIHERTVNVQPTHTVEGNRVRHEQGPIELRLDTAWVTRTTAASKALVTMLTLPLLLRHRYPLFPARRYLRQPGVQASVDDEQD